MPRRSTCGISKPFGLLSPASGQVAHVLRDRSPLTSIAADPFDLHFLGTSQAFVLSQDQTLHEMGRTPPKGRTIRAGPQAAEIGV